MRGTWAVGYTLQRVGKRCKLLIMTTNAQVAETFQETVDALNLESVREDFGRALNQAETDPSDAITAGLFQHHEVWRTNRLRLPP